MNSPDSTLPLPPERLAVLDRLPEGVEFTLVKLILSAAPPFTRTHLWTDRESHDPLRARFRTQTYDQVDRALDKVAAVLPQLPKERQPAARQRLEVPLIRKLSETNVRQGFFEQEQIDALIATLPDYLQDLTRFTYLCGWRKSEVVGLTWPMVNMAVKTITIPTSKNGRPRTLDLDGEVLAIIKHREKAATFERDGEPVVATHVFHRDGAPIGDFKKAWHSALVKAGLTHTEKVPGSTKVRIVHDVLFHDLRRTAARNLLAKGVHETVAMKITGHATRSMFDRYSIVSGDDVRKAMKEMTVSR